MHPLSGALLVPYKPVLVTRVALVANWHLFTPPCCSFAGLVPFVSLWKDLRLLSGPVLDGVGLVGFKSIANAFLLALSALSFLSPTILSFSSFHELVVWALWGWGLQTDRMFSLSPGLAPWTPVR